MGEAPITRPSLLVRIRDRTNHEAWRQFVELYGPLVYHFGRKRGLQDADAADLVQIVFQAIAKQIDELEYDPRRGTFRGWLYAVVRNQMSKQLARNRRAIEQAEGGGERLKEVADQDTDEQLWQKEYELRLFRWGIEQIRNEFEPTSWQAFWLTAVEGKSAKEAGEALGMSVGAIYTAKSRVLSRLKSVVAELKESEAQIEG
jgi:RNA polymerase sigma-70 factor (ECF subfamily)